MSEHELRQLTTHEIPPWSDERPHWYCTCGRWKRENRLGQDNVKRQHGTHVKTEAVA